MKTLGFDTSNYTTSVAWFDGEQWDNRSRLLPVKPGALGLRQSDAVFHHTVALPELTGALFRDVFPNEIGAVGVSTSPRPVAGSYMPCFLAGIAQARSLANLLHVPLVEVSHQQGHLAAVLQASGCTDLFGRPFLAWHLSGGTTELLLVEPDGWNIQCTRIGGTTDISAGQLIDRTGQLLGLPFPSGKQIDALSQQARDTAFFKVKCQNLEFSLSGVENKVQAYYAANHCPEEVAAYALRCICGVVLTATQNALRIYADYPVVFSGGVASNSMLRNTMSQFSAIFCQPTYATDNAMGVAVLASRYLGI